MADEIPKDIAKFIQPDDGIILTSRNGYDVEKMVEDLATELVAYQLAQEEEEMRAMGGPGSENSGHAGLDEK